MDFGALYDLQPLLREPAMSRRADSAGLWAKPSQRLAERGTVKVVCILAWTWHSFGKDQYSGRLE